jgi:hypothetical protein
MARADHKHTAFRAMTLSQLFADPFLREVFRRADRYALSVAAIPTYRPALPRVNGTQSACSRVDRGATIVGDFIIALAAFVAVLVPLLALLRMRERRRNRSS